MIGLQVETESASFNPDLVIEATIVCDRACPGCYAPNLISTEIKEDILARHPEKFLEPVSLLKILQRMESVPVIAIRGGEPSLHPKIDLILRIARFNGQKVFFETHGRWILSHDNSLLDSLAQNQITVKISFDRMHGLSLSELEEMTNRLDERAIEWVIAVTERTYTEFNEVCRECHWIDYSRFIFQEKVVSADKLLRPQIGVITALGELRKTLTNSLDSKEDVS